MKTINPFAGLLVSAVLLVGFLPRASGQSLTAAAEQEREAFIQELVTILNETQSSDTFLITLAILQEESANYRRLLPTVIRNAERLKLFANTDPDRLTAAQKMVVRGIDGLMNKASESANNSPSQACVPVCPPLPDSTAANDPASLRDSSEPPRLPLTINGKDAKVVIIAAHAMLPSDYTLMRSDWELGQRLTQLLEERFKENQDRVTVVRPSQVKSFMYKNPRWRELPPQEIGKHFNADWVINLEVNSISLFDVKSASFFYHGNADIMVTVTDVHKPVGEGEVFALPFQTEYPRTNPLERSEIGVNQFRARFIERIAKDLANNFTAHPAREKYGFD